MPDPRPIWQIILTDGLGSARATVSTIGEVTGCTSRQFNFNLNAASTVAFTMPMDAPHAMDILPLAGLSGADDHILIYRNGTLVMTCEISTIEITGADEDRSIAVTGTETMWVRLPKAIVGQSPTGLVGPTAATDQGTWLAGGGGSVLDNYNVSTLTDSGSQVDNAHTGIGANGTITASGNIAGGVWRYKPFMELMTELAQSTSGFDYWQTPIDPRVDQGFGLALTGKLNIAPTKGTTSANPNVVFEYGTKFPNAASYHFTIDNTNEANRFISLPPSFPDSGGLKVRSRESTGRSTTMGMREMLVDADLSDADLRDALLKNYRDVLRYGRKVFEIQPMPQTNEGLVPEFIDHYTTGDIIRGRVVDRGVTLCDALVRVYGVSVELDENGMETDTITWVQES